MDIDKAFRKYIDDVVEKTLYGTTLSSAAPEEPPKSSDDLIAEIRRIQADLGPPPPKVRFSKHVPAFVEAKPTAKAATGDMQAMLDHIGPQRVSGGYQFGDTIFVNPVHFKDAK